MKKKVTMKESENETSTVDGACLCVCGGMCVLRHFGF